METSGSNLHISLYWTLFFDNEKWENPPPRGYIGLCDSCVCVCLITSCLLSIIQSLPTKGLKLTIYCLYYCQLLCQQTQSIVCLFVSCAPYFNSSTWTSGLLVNMVLWLFEKCLNLTWLWCPVGCYYFNLSITLPFQDKVEQHDMLVPCVCVSVCIENMYI